MNDAHPLRWLAASLSLLVAWGMLGCGRSSSGPKAPSATAGAVPTLSYAVEVSEGMEDLLIAAHFPRGTPVGWAVDRPAVPYVKELRIQPAGSEIEYDWTDTGEEECRLRGCSLTYRFALGQAAREISSRMVADYFGDAIVAPPSTWLVRPSSPKKGSRQRYSVKTRGAIRFGTGTDPVAGQRNTYESLLPEGFHAPYAAFGPLREKLISVGERELSVYLLSDRPQPFEQEYLDWIAESGSAVAKYFGQFPSEHTAVFVTPFDYHGSQMGIGGASIILGTSTQRLPAESGRLWVAAHEMVHVGFPGTSRQHRWASEGLATYVESVARAQAGLITTEALWSLLMRRLPEGQPTTRDRGLDVTRTWARTYWGGALFWFQADVEIARATKGNKSLREALRGLVRAGGNSSSYWPLRRTLKTMDEAVGVEVLLPLYERHSHAAVPVRLEPIFSRMGISGDPDALTFDDFAPEAHVRRIIEGR